MYTGIVTHQGRVESIEPAGTAVDAMRLRVRPEPVLEGLAVGDSVSVDGVCLTVTELDSGMLSFDAIPETLRKTTLGDLAPGAGVNLEAPLRIGDALGGHFVQGHVDGVGTVRAVEQQGEDVRLVVGVTEALHRDMLPKGSVTLDGVSLTLGEVWREEGEDREGRFSVYLIPHTLAVTGLGTKAVGARVNVEADVLGRWVRHHLRGLGQDVTDR